MNEFTMGIRAVIMDGKQGRMGWQISIDPALIERIGVKRFRLSMGRLCPDDSGRLLNKPGKGRRYFASFTPSRIPDWPIPTMEWREKGTFHTQLRQVSTEGEFAFDVPSELKSSPKMPQSYDGSLDDVRIALQMLNEALAANPDVSVTVEDGRVRDKVKRVVVTEEDL